MVAAGANPIQITKGIEKTAKALVSELKLMSKEVNLGCFSECDFIMLNCKCLLTFSIVFTVSRKAVFRFYSEHS